jgi:hypothetical protein
MLYLITLFLAVPAFCIVFYYGVRKITDLWEWLSDKISSED